MSGSREAPSVSGFAYIRGGDGVMHECVFFFGRLSAGSRTSEIKGSHMWAFPKLGGYPLNGGECRDDDEGLRFRVSENQEYQFGDPSNKDCSMLWGAILGSSLWKPSYWGALKGIFMDILVMDHPLYEAIIHFGF